MSNILSKYSYVLSFTIGIFLGIIAKVVDTPDILLMFPIFDDIMARFGIWVWVATLIAVLSKNSFRASLNTFVFFVGMLSTYYVYTILFLNFFPKSQIILWSCIALITPFCGFLIWYIHKKNNLAILIGSLPLILLITEWYFTASDNLLLLSIAYLCMLISLLAVIPTNKNRLLSFICGLLMSFILIMLIRKGIMINPYDQLLNI